jgi:hypothetical protein
VALSRAARVTMTTERGHTAGANATDVRRLQRLLGRLRVDFRNLPRTPKHCGDLDEIGRVPIHDPILPRDNLSQIRSLSLRHHSARIGKLSKTLNSGYKAPHGEIGPGRRINLNECANLFEISD